MLLVEQAFKVLWLVTLAGICFAVPCPAPGRVQKRAWSKVTLLVEVPVFRPLASDPGRKLLAVPSPAPVYVQEGRFGSKVMLLVEIPKGSLASNATGRNLRFSGSSGSQARRAGTAFKRTYQVL